jgi:hypothetical protein
MIRAVNEDDARNHTDMKISKLILFQYTRYDLKHNLSTMRFPRFTDFKSLSFDFIEVL